MKTETSGSLDKNAYKNWCDLQEVISDIFVHRSPLWAGLSSPAEITVHPIWDKAHGKIVLKIIVAYSKEWDPWFTCLRIHPTFNVTFQWVIVELEKKNSTTVMPLNSSRAAQ